MNPLAHLHPSGVSPAFQFGNILSELAPALELAHRAELPAIIWPVLERMREQDWLGSYGDMACVRLT